jgi:ABC-type nitrate/sulfonate/bicarbonate transport system substrate-binding protein
MKNNREMVQRTLAALTEAVTWIRANRDESARMIAGKFKVSQTEAENTYGTLVKMLNKDGRLNPKVARGYIELLRQDRPIPADFDVQKILDFSLLPAAPNK